MSVGFRRSRDPCGPGRPLRVLDGLFEGLVGMAVDRTMRCRLDATLSDVKMTSDVLRASRPRLHTSRMRARAPVSNVRTHVMGRPARDRGRNGHEPPSRTGPTDAASRIRGSGCGG